MAAESIPSESEIQQDPSLPTDIAARIHVRWKQAYNSQSETDLRALYDEWAPTYDEDHDAIGCFHPRRAAELFSQHLIDRNAQIVDAGAGTGAAGIELAKLGFRNITALDFSFASLMLGGTRFAFRTAVIVNLNRPYPIGSNTIDAALAVGLFSFGQVQNQALYELLRIIRSGGLLVFTQRTDFHASNAMGFRETMERLTQHGIWKLLEITEPEPYLPRKEPDAMFRVWAYEIL